LNAKLVLEDGTTVTGDGFGAETEVTGEIVFCTSMTGYQEALTDPSYAGQILLLTYPLVGNYGVNPGDYESDRIQVEGFLVREYCEQPDHSEADQTLHEFLKGEGIPGLANLDTRAMTLRIRDGGVVKGSIKTSSEPIDEDELLETCRNAPDYGELDLVSRVSRDEPIYHEGPGEDIAVIDLGMKHSIRDNLLDRGCGVHVLPAETSAEDILERDVDGVVISPGPGDPENVPGGVDRINNLLGEVPVFGICLGHQLLAHAAGGDTYKLKFGHRGANQPVKDLNNDRIYITSQNHGYAVDDESLPEDKLEVDKINLNDETVEGMQHREHNAMSVQYHPEACPGPQDSSYLFDDFLEMVQDAS
jgi:carbamoyl-phosphate synthase small subunit